MCSPQKVKAGSCWLWSLRVGTSFYQPISISKWVGEPGYVWPQQREREDLQHQVRVVLLFVEHLLSSDHLHLVAFYLNKEKEIVGWGWGRFTYIGSHSDLKTKHFHQQVGRGTWLRLTSTKRERGPPTSSWSISFLICRTSPSDHHHFVVFDLNKERVGRGRWTLSLPTPSNHLTPFKRSPHFD